MEEEGEYHRHRPLGPEEDREQERTPSGLQRRTLEAQRKEEAPAPMT